MTEPEKKKFYNLYRSNKREIERKVMVIEENIFVLMVEIRELTMGLKSKPKKKMIEFYNSFAKVSLSNSIFHSFFLKHKTSGRN
jgi:ethanolamine transporter EutH